MRAVAGMDLLGCGKEPEAAGSSEGLCLGAFKQRWAAASRVTVSQRTAPRARSPCLGLPALPSCRGPPKETPLPPG